MSTSRLYTRTLTAALCLIASSAWGQSAATAGIPTAATPPASFTAPVAPGVRLPDVPGSQVASPMAPPSVSRPDVDLKAMTPSTKVIQAQPGKMIAATISQRFPNRLVTPFKNPVLGAGSDVNLDIHGEGSVIYLTVKRPNGQPIAFYLMERGDQESAIPMMLTPADVGMVDIRLVGSETMDAVAPQAADAKAAGSWEAASDFTATIAEFMRRTAMGEVPPGYGLRAAKASDMFPACSFAGIRLEPAQVMTGNHLVGFVQRATNVSGGVIEIDESQCGSVGVVGVAAWPNVLLQPGQSTEIFILRQVTRRETSHQARPSTLLGGAL